jgi:hypothetical protein
MKALLGIFLLTYTIAGVLCIVATSVATFKRVGSFSIGGFEVLFGAYEVRLAFATIVTASVYLLS